MGEMFLDDGDVRLYQGDVEAVLAGMPDESVDCVVTSPPYWGLRDYGTGLWDGGDPDCDHQVGSETRASEAKSGLGGGKSTQGHRKEGYGSICGKCGSHRADQQLGLEPTPDLYVERMVAVFREVRRVLAAHGTCWVNLGDSYAGSWSGTSMRPEGGSQRPGEPGFQPLDDRVPSRAGNVPDGLKPKDLVGIPWRVAFALQADGWWLRADIIWAKPNPMPESVTDRPTKAHEYVFLLTKAPRYYFDQEAVRERLADPLRQTDPYPTTPSRQPNGRQPNSLPPAIPGGYIRPAAGARNVRSVWQIATQPYPEAHFATYPEGLVRRCVLAGCPERVCVECGAPWERVVEMGEHKQHPSRWGDKSAQQFTRRDGDYNYSPTLGRIRSRETVDFQPSCGGHGETDVSSGRNATASFAGTHRPGVVLDPFIGSGTTCKVARDHGRHSIGIDLSADYLSLAARRLQQLSLLT